MKTRLLPWGFIGMAAAIFLSCSDDEKTKTLPEITTSEVTNVTATSAMGGGEITSNGNTDITARGLVYSSTNATPTLSDSKTEVTGTDDAFTSNLEGLTSGITYHVRAYATNNVGTGYGDVVDFTTNNMAPTAANVVINGTVEVDQEVTVDYDYDDAENDAESGTTFQWYVANDPAGSGEVAIEGATSLSYTIDINYEFKYLRVGVTPKSGAGTTTGVEVKSEFSQVAVSTTMVHFIYNGQEVAYGIITSSITGHKWLDRNIGAQRAATSYRDYLAYGDLFQWGRSTTDGHQLITWTGEHAGSPVNGTTTTKFTSDVTGSALFYIDPTNGNPPFDWRDPQNDDLWQSPNQVNSPCPAGWHIPTNAEWDAEIAGASSTVIVADVLKLSVPADFRHPMDGTLASVGYYGVYWSSSTRTSSVTGRKTSYKYTFARNDLNNDVHDLKFSDFTNRNEGHSCRCIEDE